MKNRSVHRKKKVRAIEAWPEAERSPEVVAAEVTYVGSAEHKDYPSPAGDPGLRSDATRCPPYPRERWGALQEALRDAVRARCVSGDPFDPGGFPRYVWGYFEGQLFEARHLSGAAGKYKAYPLEDWEGPRDPKGRLVKP